ncbi:MAG: DUF523 domain-containing protein [Fibrobacterota bacterium]
MKSKNRPLSPDKSLFVSPCLMGVKCRYNSASKKSSAVLDFTKDCRTFSVCPETDSGLTVPRPPSEIQGGDGYNVINGKSRITDDTGKDLTEYFIRGARKALDICLLNGVTTAILKDKSAACGVNVVYDGTFSGKLVEGCGVLTALLRKHGINIICGDTLE